MPLIHPHTDPVIMPSPSADKWSSRTLFRQTFQQPTVKGSNQLNQQSTTPTPSCFASFFAWSIQGSLWTKISLPSTHLLVYSYSLYLPQSVVARLTFRLIHLSQVQILNQYSQQFSCHFSEKSHTPKWHWTSLATCSSSPSALKGASWTTYASSLLT